MGSVGYLLILILNLQSIPIIPSFRLVRNRFPTRFACGNDDDLGGYNYKGTLPKNDSCVKRPYRVLSTLRSRQHHIIIN